MIGFSGRKQNWRSDARGGWWPRHHGLDTSLQMEGCGSTQENCETNAWRSAQDQPPSPRGACSPLASTLDISPNTSILSRCGTLAWSVGWNCVVAGGAVVDRGCSSGNCSDGWASVGAADACRQRERNRPACGGAGGASRPGRQSLRDRRAARVALLSIAAPLQRELVTRYTYRTL